MPTGSPDIDYKVVQEKCTECEGEGVKPAPLLRQFVGGRPTTCQYCRGKGYISKYVLKMLVGKN